MKRRVLPILSGFAILAALACFARAAEPKNEPEKKPKLILNAAEANPEYSYDQWDKKVTPVKGGLFVDAQSGKGGFGGNDLKVDADGIQAVEIALFTGRSNAANAITLSFTDVYGSEISWTLRIDQISPVQAVKFRLKLSDGKLTLKGKRTNFDYTELKGYQIKGDWNDQPVQVTVLGIRGIY